MGGASSNEESQAPVEKTQFRPSKEAAKPATRRYLSRNTMAANSKSVCLGSINLSVIKGDLTKEKADVIVCTASKNLNLSKGRASKVLMEAAGEGIQQDCNSNYEDGIDYDDVAMVSPGKLSCKKVYFVALPIHSSSGSEVQILSNIVTQCLENASQNKSKTMAMPALGTGFLKYPAKVVASTMLQCVEDFSKNNQSSSLKHISVVVYFKDQDTHKAFVSEARGRATSCHGNSGASGGGAKQKTSPHRHFNPLQSILSAKPKVTGNSIGDVQVSIVAGKLAKFKADVLVDNTTAKLKLDNGGLSESLLEVAGSQLQDECTNSYPDGVKSGKIVVTDGYNLKCSKVYHGSLPKWDKSYESKKILCKFVCKCLQQAHDDEYTSIAFPTLGTGSLKFPADVAAKTMFQCIIKHASNTSLTDVSIVVYDGGDNWKQIKSVFEQELANCQDKSSSAESDSDDTLFSEDFVLPIATKLPTPPAVVKSKFRAKLPKSVAPQPAPWLKRGTKDWLMQMYKDDPRTPSYWTSFHSQKTLKDWHTDSEDLKPCVITVDKATFNAVSKVIEDTWQSQFVGHGRDAVGLGNLNYSNIKVKKIERIENTQLFEKYAQRRQNLLLKASKFDGFKSLENVPGSSGNLMTTANIQSGSVLAKDVYPEINEHYLFHGTKEAVVDTIQHQGLDNRLSSTNPMFGSGIYGAESSTKADQYADVKSSRSSGEKKMLLVRMCLGDIFVQKNAQSFVRAPCRSCQKDKCTCTESTMFDSVVGDGTWNFREFVIYEKNQIYPEYVITYVRVM